MDYAKKDIIILKEKFDKIKKTGWINSHSKSYSSGGILFEKLIGKRIENSELPDFGNVEIKTKCSKEKEFITLFNASPDKDSFEIKRIQKLFGYPDRKNSDFKVFNLTFSSNKYTKVSNRFSFKLGVDFIKRKVVLMSLDKYSSTSDIVTSWTFDLLKKKLCRKLRYLLLVISDKKLVQNELYYKFHSYVFYELKDFDEFLQLIQQGVIIITFSIGVFRSGKRKGQIHDRGTSFRIKVNDLPRLFNKLPY